MPPSQWKCWRDLPYNKNCHKALPVWAMALWTLSQPAGAQPECEQSVFHLVRCPPSCGSSPGTPWAPGGWGRGTGCRESWIWAGGILARSLLVPSCWLVIFVLLGHHQNVHTSSCCWIFVSGLLRDRLFQVAQSVPACGPARLLCPGGRAWLHLPERTEHGVRGHGLQQRLPGAADIQRGGAAQLVSTPASCTAVGTARRALGQSQLGLVSLTEHRFSQKIAFSECMLNLALPE